MLSILFLIMLDKNAFLDNYQHICCAGKDVITKQNKKN